ncbi:MAG: PDZ domain-containing protein [Abditibacteriales bacterium]|nr:PDZ domain-containing protein [Abditibacteriales bacterium]MDW8366428.1 PDZ domain-containing protein [Abditibacteriales bacterium]
MEAGDYRLSLVGLQRKRTTVLNKPMDVLLLGVRAHAKSGTLPEDFQDWPDRPLLEDDQGRRYLWCMSSRSYHNVLQPDALSPEERERIEMEHGAYWLGFNMPAADAQRIRRFRGAVGHGTVEEEMTWGPVSLTHLPSPPTVKGDFVFQLHRFGKSQTDPASLDMPLEGGLIMSHKQPGLYLEAVFFTLEPAKESMPSNTHWQIHIGDLRDEQGNVHKFQRWKQWRYPQHAHAILGVRTMEVSPQDLQRFSLSSGVEVAEVVPNTPAQKGGLKNGDLIVRVGNHLVPNSPESGDALFDLLERFKPGQTVPVEIVRGGKRQTLRVTLGGHSCSDPLPSWLPAAKAQAILRQLSAAAGSARVNKKELRVYLIQAGPIPDATFAPTTMTLTFQRHGFKATPFVFEDIPLPPKIMEAK